MPTNYSSPGAQPQQTTQMEKSKAVVTGAQLEKPSELKKMGKALIGGTWGDIKTHTLYDVLIPGIKRIALDAVSLLLFGTPINRANGNVWTNPGTGLMGKTTNVNYTGFWNQGNNFNDIQPKAIALSQAASNAGFTYADVTLPDEKSAYLLKDQIEDWIDRGYNAISCARLYDMAGISGYPATANQFGWRGLATVANCNIIQKMLPDGSVGYTLKMPSCVPLRPDEIR